jgi:UV DNA damage endonuclease
MKIGYPCINHSIGKKTISTFRLQSYSEAKVKQCIEYNLNCLLEILHYNIDHGLYFFRISSDIIPFASHPIFQIQWKDCFSRQLNELGHLIKENDIRISMHPDQFVLLNSPNPSIINNSIKELDYQSGFLDELDLESTAKIQIHVGGVYQNKEESIKRFIETYKSSLSNKIKSRLVIENDDYRFDLFDCLRISKEIGIPVILDIFHNECLGQIPVRDAINFAAETWQDGDGTLMIDYSHQEPNSRKGKHSNTLNPDLFEKFICNTKGMDFDIMLEIKDKEKSAIQAKLLLERIKTKRK